MGLFGKKKAKERNEINNKELKERLADAALSMLKQDEDYIRLAYTKVEFGYLFDIDKHGVEALFKIITDKSTFYFAAQKTSVIQLNFNEAAFNDVTDTFLELRA
jgi:hypothetical protein